MTDPRSPSHGVRQTRVMVEGFGQRAAAAQDAMRTIADHLRSGAPHPYTAAG